MPGRGKASFAFCKSFTALLALQSPASVAAQPDRSRPFREAGAVFRPAKGLNETQSSARADLEVRRALDQQAIAETNTSPALDSRIREVRRTAESDARLHARNGLPPPLREPEQWVSPEPAAESSDPSLIVPCSSWAPR